MVTLNWTVFKRTVTIIIEKRGNLKWQETEVTNEFKQKMVELYNSGKPRAELVREYELTRSALSPWIKKFNNTGSFDIDDNRSNEEKN